MKTSTEKLMTLTAGDLMTADVVQLPEKMPLREAANLLIRNQIGGAPVVDAKGQCVGILSAVDFLRLAGKRDILGKPVSTPLPVSCSFWVKRKTPDGREVTLCTLPPGVCPIQVKQTGPDNEEMIVCSQPHCVLVDWQQVDLEKLPNDEVANYMTPDPVTVPADISIRALARLLIDAHIHRVIVVDERQSPTGIVTSTDVLAAVAYAEDE
jgi:CBS domain-containing protein